MHKSIASIDRKIATLRLARSLKLVDLQSVCKHELVAECDYQHSEWGTSRPPIRVCETCGMTEDGWGSGYSVLRADRVRNVSRDDLYQMRAGLMLQDHHKGPLRRGECTVEQLVRGEVTVCPSD